MINDNYYLFGFEFFETGSYFVTQTGLQLLLSFPSFQSAGITGIHCHVQLYPGILWDVFTRGQQRGGVTHGATLKKQMLSNRTKLSPSVMACISSKSQWENLMSEIANWGQWGWCDKCLFPWFTHSLSPSNQLHLKHVVLNYLEITSITCKKCI